MNHYQYTCLWRRLTARFRPRENAGGDLRRRKCTGRNVYPPRLLYGGPGGYAAVTAVTIADHEEPASTQRGTRCVVSPPQRQSHGLRNRHPLIVGKLH